MTQSQDGLDRISRGDDGDDDSHLRIAQRAGDGARSRVQGSGEMVDEAHEACDAVVVVIAGEFDLGMAGPVREALTRAITDPRQRLIVDLSEVTFIDSSGLHVICDAYELCRDAQPTLIIRPGPPNVQRVFGLANLLDDLPFETVPLDSCRSERVRSRVSDLSISTAAPTPGRAYGARRVVGRRL